MKRVVTALFSAALLFGSAVSANAAATPGVCDQAAMDKILELGYVWPTPWDNCQFKLFLPDAGPGWTENEWFHGGDFFSIPAKKTNLPGTPGYQDVLNYYAHIEEHVYWGKAVSPVTPQELLPLSRGPIRMYKGPLYGGQNSTIFSRETYVNFPPQTPGRYVWRYTWRETPNDPLSVVTGYITIRPAS